MLVSVVAFLLHLVSYSFHCWNTVIPPEVQHQLSLDEAVGTLHFNWIKLSNSSNRHTGLIFHCIKKNKNRKRRRVGKCMISMARIWENSHPMVLCVFGWVSGCMYSRKLRRNHILGGRKKNQMGKYQQGRLCEGDRRIEKTKANLK